MSLSIAQIPDSFFPLFEACGISNHCSRGYIFFGILLGQILWANKREEDGKARWVLPASH
jgi:hypothetical protein